jgi:hypothetical protein
VVRKRELNAAAAAKRLQIMVALRILHHEKLSKFLRTEVGPRLMWQPKVHCPETLTLLDARAADFVAFKVNPGPACHMACHEGFSNEYRPSGQLRLSSF